MSRNHENRKSIMEVTGLSTTSYWIRFFKAAGVPAGDAANYAVAFSDNRIQRGMLMDLTKEYLNDMGITRLGDVIAILKHAKSVHAEDAREKVLQESQASPSSHGVLSVSSISEGSKGSPSGSPGLTRKGRSTPVSRIVDHYIGNDPQAAPMNQPSPPTAIKRAASTGVIRLNSGKQKEVVPVPKVRRVFPEHEGKYKITMPAGTTARTKKILEQQRLSISETRAGKKNSVFDRLGRDAAGGDTPSSSSMVTVTGLDKVVMRPGDDSLTGISSVFNRLGAKTTVKRAATSTSDDLLSADDDEDSTPNDAPLQYEGVLKNIGKKPKSANPDKVIKFNVTLQSPLQERLGKLVVTEKSDGRLASDTVSGCSKSVKDRLGGVVTAPASSTTSGAISSGKPTTVVKLNKLKTLPRALPSKGKLTSLKTGGIRTRLGGPADVSSSADVSTTVGKKINLKSKGAKSMGVFGRLGQQV